VPVFTCNCASNFAAVGTSQNSSWKRPDVRNDIICVFLINFPTLPYSTVSSLKQSPYRVIIHDIITYIRSFPRWILRSKKILDLWLYIILFSQSVNFNFIFWPSDYKHQNKVLDITKLYIGKWLWKYKPPNQASILTFAEKIRINYMFGYLLVHRYN
jgi:hypothetical protein